jgi:hypothetical protein
MAVPHYNYYPPAGSVIDASDGRVTWDGHAWKLNGKVYGVPSSHRLMGKAGGPLAGWTYDWQKHAWMEPSAPKPPVTRLPQRPQPTRPQPGQAPQTALVAVEHKKMSPIDSLMKHPVAPVVGGLLVAASYLTDEPTPPTVPEGLPESTAKQWMMVYNQNQQRFSRRMDLYKELGLVLLGISSAQTIIDVMSKASSPVVAVDPTVHARSLAGHRAM